MTRYRRRPLADILSYSPVYRASSDAAQAALDRGANAEEVLEDLALTSSAVASKSGVGIDKAIDLMKRLHRGEEGAKRLAASAINE